MVYAAPLAVMLGLWLPGCNDGWFHTDSHYYAAVGMEAWRTHEFVELRLGDAPYHNKPPLALLIHGWFLSTFGVKMWVARLPSLIAAMGGTLGVVKLVSMLGGRRLALLSGLVLVTTLEYTRYTRAISLDLWLGCAMVWGLVAVAWAWRDGRPWRVVWAGLAVGLGLLIKPIVALFVLVAGGVWLFVTGRRAGAWWGALLVALAVALAVAAPWFVAMVMRFPGSFADTFFVKQSLERLGWETNREWWYYLSIAVQSYWPWIAAAVAAGVLSARGRMKGDRARDLLVLAWVWSLAWLVMISLAGDKHGRYAVPSYLLLCVPVAWWVAAALPRAARAVRRAMLTWVGPAVAACGLVVSAGAMVAGVQLQKPRSEVWDTLMGELSAHPPAGVRTTAAANKAASHVVLLGREWPRLVTEASPAQAGEVVLMQGDEAREALADGLRGEKIAEGKEVTAFRLEAQWPRAKGRR